MKDLYGKKYGYKSNLTKFMRNHLNDIANYASSLVKLKMNDCVLDIGSNDATLLKSYMNKKINLFGIDPIAKKYFNEYPANATLICDFFSKENYFSVSKKKLKIITSISMFYDLPDPSKFVNDIKEVLHDNGVWVFEQSYLPSMLSQNSYDTICHEHLEYYSLKAIKFILNKSNLKIIDISLNDLNGGSIRIAVMHKNSKKNESTLAKWLLNQEKISKIHQLSTYKKFYSQINKTKKDLISLLLSIKRRKISSWIWRVY